MTKSICTRYAFVLIITLIAIAVISFILQVLFQIELSSAGGIVSIMVPAMDAGMTYYRKVGSAPNNQIRWAFARYFTFIQIVFGAIVLALLLIVFPELSELLLQVGQGIWIAITVFYLAIIFLVSRYFFGFGITTAQKAANKT